MYFAEEYFNFRAEYLLRKEVVFVNLHTSKYKHKLDYHPPIFQVIGPV